MRTLDDLELLRRYAEKRSEAAFSEIVRRHLNLVYSAALRVVGGDAHLAEDVAQIVFRDLARQAARSSPPLSMNQPTPASLPGGELTTDEAPLLGGAGGGFIAPMHAPSEWRLSLKSLPGWLYTSTCFAATKVVRGEQRRHTREQEAYSMREPHEAPASDSPWNQLRPVIDAAMLELGDEDREAVVLRYFDGRKLAEVGNRLGLSESAARMRVERAMEKLRVLLPEPVDLAAQARVGLMLDGQGY